MQLDANTNIWQYIFLKFLYLWKGNILQEFAVLSEISARVWIDYKIKNKQNELKVDGWTVWIWNVYVDNYARTEMNEKFLNASPQNFYSQIFLNRKINNKCLPVGLFRILHQTEDLSATLCFRLVHGGHLENKKERESE